MDTDAGLQTGVAQGTKVELKKESKWKNGLEWPAVLWIGFLHLGALAAPFYFSWVGLTVFAVMSWITGSLGICIGFHRLLTHSSFETYRRVKVHRSCGCQYIASITASATRKMTRTLPVMVPGGVI